VKIVRPVFVHGVIVTGLHFLAVFGEAPEVVTDIRHIPSPFTVTCVETCALTQILRGHPKRGSVETLSNIRYRDNTQQALT
jgi:hypothetical protein